MLVPWLPSLLLLCAGGLLLVITIPIPSERSTFTVSEELHRMLNLRLLKRNVTLQEDEEQTLGAVFRLIGTTAIQLGQDLPSRPDDGVPTLRQLAVSRQFDLLSVESDPYTFFTVEAVLEVRGAGSPAPFLERQNQTNKQIYRLTGMPGPGRPQAPHHPAPPQPAL
jgi:hypothetical protein